MEKVGLKTGITTAEKVRAGISEKCDVLFLHNHSRLALEALGTRGRIPRIGPARERRRASILKTDRQRLRNSGEAFENGLKT